ncbi:hypothetical protein C7N43_19480 [Sphingobacteriales bacterium UPWRP_1]|nr:hypothetical protein B6N25_01975 [Sphingobacteriales bacterium TSM_CSS]PSJ75325.1 hypothetical protein C7N43_19480 [Sphingobacteriales bacterium UPWRP_1]
MKQFATLNFVALLLCGAAMAQPAFNCDETFLTYYKLGTVQPVSDMQAFCNGAQEAYYTGALMLKWQGNIEEVSSCTRFSYEKNSIQLVFMGNNLTPAQLDAMEGFNFVMTERIKQQLGKNYDELGNFGPMYFGPENIFTETFYSNFNNSLVISKTGGNQIHVKLEHAHVFPSYMNKIKIEDKDNGQQFSFTDLEKGLTLEITNQNKSEKMKLLRFLLDDFNEPFYCKASSLPNAFIVWIDLKKLF